MAETAAYLARTDPRFERVIAVEHKGARHLYVGGAAVGRRAAHRHDRRDRRPAHGHGARRDAADRPAPRPPGRARRGARGVAEDLAGPAAGDGADHRRGAELDRRGAGQTAPARRRQGRDRDLHAHARAAALLPRAVPHERRPAGRAARRARQPRVVLRHRRARALAQPPGRRSPRPRRPARRPAHADDPRAVRRAAHDRRRERGGRGVRDRDPAPAARRPTAHRPTHAAHRPAPALAEPRRVRQRRPVRRDEGRARGPAQARAGRAVGREHDDHRAQDRLGPRHEPDARQRRDRAARRGAPQRPHVRPERDGVAAHQPARHPPRRARST